MVLILTDQFDEHANVVIKTLKEQKLPYYRFDLDVDSLKKTHITYYNDKWIISSTNGAITSDEVKCVWCRRPFVELSLQEQEIIDIDFRIWKNEWNKTLLGFYNSIKNIPWLNPLRKAYKGENKYYQMELAREIGLNIPETLISNDKRLLKEFISNKQNKALFKLMSQEIYNIGNNNFRGFYTNVISNIDIERFCEIEENHIVLQEYVEKDYEVRYTVIGKEHFVCRIDSQQSSKAKEDWRRYDIARTPHYRIDAPKEIAVKVNCLLERLGLEYGALDFIVTPEGKWVFLEINCMGQWLWIEQLTGLPISKAIAKWIAAHIIATGGFL